MRNNAARDIIRKLKAGEEKIVSPVTKAKIFDYGIYDIAVSITYDFMLSNALSAKAYNVAELLKPGSRYTNKKRSDSYIRAAVLKPIGRLAIANYLLYKNSDNNSFWDLKPKLKHIVNEARVAVDVGSLRKGDKFLYTPIKNDDSYLYFYDIWGNISWGYIAASCGFFLQNLQAGNFFNNLENNVIGASNSDDQFGIEIGYKLFMDHSYNLGRGDLEHSLFINRWQFTENTTRVTPDKLLYITSQ